MGALLDFLTGRTKERSIEHALEGIAPKQVVKRAAKRAPSHELIETVCSSLRWDVEKVSERVAEALGLSYKRAFEVPERGFVEKLGFSVEQLQSLHAFPIKGETASYALAIAAPERIDRAAFEKNNIPLYLTTGRKVKDLWRRLEGYDQQPHIVIPQVKLFSLLKNLARDAKDCGGHEVFVGHPTEQHYEFISGQEKFTGSLHPAVYPSLLTLFEEENKLSRTLHDDSLFESLSVSLTRSFERAVVCLTWKEKGSSEEKVAEIKRTAAKSAPASVRVEPIGAEALPKGKRVLLIDDDERFLTILSSIFSSKGYLVQTSHNGKVALEKLAQAETKPDLIVSDIHMPQMDGATFLRELKEKRLDIPTLMLTSDDDSLLEVEIALLGADALVRKQEDPKILLAWCANLVRRAEQAA